MRIVATMVGVALPGMALAALGGCTVTVNQDSLLPALAEPATRTDAPLPPGYLREERRLALRTLGIVHAVRLHRPGNAATIPYSGGNGSFTATAGARPGRLATMTGADIVAYDYPGRGGTTVPKTVDALISLGPELRDALAAAGWIGGGPLYAYGFSFGGAPAANIARAGGVSGLILEATAADIAAVGRNMIPGVLKPFVRIAVSDDLRRYDYAGYATAAKAPILLLVGRDDRTVDLRTVRRFGDRLRAAGADVTLIVTPGGHGDALGAREAEAALADFVRRPVASFPPAER